MRSDDPRVLARKQPKTTAEDPYSWFKIADLPYTNSSNRFIVVVGAASLRVVGDSNSVLQITHGADIIDWIIVTEQTAAGFLDQTMPRRMLIPPSAVVDSSVATKLSLVICNTLKDALLIL